MTKGWTSPALAEPTSDNPAVNRYFKDLHERSKAWENQEPSLPSEDSTAGKDRDAAANKAWSDWYERKPSNDRALMAKHGVGGRAAG